MGLLRHRNRHSGSKSHAAGNSEETHGVVCWKEKVLSRQVLPRYQSAPSHSGVVYIEIDLLPPDMTELNQGKEKFSEQRQT